MLPGTEDTGAETVVDPAALFELTATGGDEDTADVVSEAAGTDDDVEAAGEVKARLDGPGAADGAGAGVELTGPGETGQTVV